MKSIKTLLMCMSVLLFISCGGKEDEMVNNAPGEFSITLGRADGGEMGVTWSEAVDPDKDKVIYDVYVDDVLKNSDLEKREVIVKYGLRVSSVTVKVIAKDSKGATSEASATKTFAIKVI